MSYDANWLDATSMLLGVVNMFVQKFRKKIGLEMRLAYEWFNGASLPPVIALIIGAWASSLILYLAQASRPTLCFAGITAMIAVLQSIQRKSRN